MRTVFYTLLLTIFLISCTSEEELIRKSFNDYKNAVLNNKGTEAIQYLHVNTASYFFYILPEMKYADSLEVNSYPPKDKFFIFLTRHLCTKEEMLKFNRNTLITFIIDKWSIGKSDIESLTIDKINVNKDEATARIFSYDLKTPYHINFYKEKELWKIDLSPTYASINRGLRQMIIDSGMEENEFIFHAIKEFSGQAPKRSIWNKVLRRQKVRAVIRKPT